MAAKVLVVSHHLEIGGSQTNCIDLATAVRDHLGYEVVFCATPGPAAAILEQRGFRLIELGRPRSAPSPALAAQIGRAVRQERPDIVHAYEWQQILDTYYGAHLPLRVPMLGTVMSMAVLRMLPRSIPLTYGTEQLVTDARPLQRAEVSLLEPPVDTDADAPGTTDVAGWRAEHGLDGDALTVVVVSRLISWLKAEGLFRAIDAVAELDGRHRVQLVIVGGGPVEVDLGARAGEVNLALGRRAVVLTGSMIDPRPAYDAADIVLGMGGSVLRGMSFAKACIVLGEGGFSEPMRPDTAPMFLRQGLYGVGTGAPSHLAAQIADLASDASARRELGSSARELVVSRYGLPASAANLDGMYRRARAWRAPVPLQALDTVATLGRRAASRVPDRLRPAAFRH